jgi:uncharacterized protein YdaU (DUF1376 family)
MPPPASVVGMEAAKQRTKQNKTKAPTLPISFFSFCWDEQTNRKKKREKKRRPIEKGGEEEGFAERSVEKRRREKTEQATLGGEQKTATEGSVAGVGEETRKKKGERNKEARE